MTDLRASIFIDQLQTADFGLYLHLDAWNLAAHAYGCTDC